MSLKNLTWLILMVTVGLAACKKGSTPQSQPEPTKHFDVYIVGRVKAANGDSVATYWKNGVPHYLADSSRSSSATSIVIDDKDIYIGGFVFAANGHTVATYWKNGIISKARDSSTNSVAHSIAVQGNDVYLAGYTNLNSYLRTATYWKNGIATKLRDTTANYIGDADAYAVKVFGNDVYVAGYVRGAEATYWKNGVETLLGPGEIHDIAMKGNEVCFYGFGGYWKDGKIVTVGNVNSGFFTNIKSVALQGNDFYMVGAMGGYTGVIGVYNYGVPPAYSKNEIITNLIIDMNKFYYSPEAIAVAGNDVYVVGYFNDEYAVYWKNNSWIQLSKTKSHAFGVAVQEY